MSSNNSKPTTKVSLDLDALDREGAPEQFSIRLGGRVYSFEDAMNVDWQSLILALQDPHRFFRLTLSDEDAKAFLAEKLPVWKMRRLMDDYREHHGMSNLGDPAALSS
jgi:hypothetical protein